MKKLILLFTIISGLAFGQIKTEIIDTGEYIGRTGYSYIKKKDNQIDLCYKNIKYSSIMDMDCVSFSDNNSNLENLYKTIVDGMSNPPKEGLLVSIEDTEFKLKFSRHSTTFVKYENGMFISSSGPISKGQIDKLFGKR
ncbi:hypothetical protein J2X97_000391 [Epilithonimonas hungarica]|uniref:hypothetical protein n=1 Tax=Epilithonimonas hungarica TaxID=454006 RepID=UPI00277F0B07|nr:hypothetical protein [Epilithonimonas hungarica]MDP9954754.1 hypothetical protein [Epilithonimonas hungarica]